MPERLPYFEKNVRYRLYVRHLYRNGIIGLNKVAEYLDLPLIEARKVVQQWDVGS
jgi:predicted HTH domain antitoxin